MTAVGAVPLIYAQTGRATCFVHNNLNDPTFNFLMKHRDKVNEAVKFQNRLKLE